MHKLRQMDDAINIFAKLKHQTFYVLNRDPIDDPFSLLYLT
jgi:hypothetical protein